MTYSSQVDLFNLKINPQNALKCDIMQNVREETTEKGNHNNSQILMWIRIIRKAW